MGTVLAQNTSTLNLIPRNTYPQRDSSMVSLFQHLTLSLHLSTKAFRETELSVKCFSTQTREGKNQKPVPVIL